MIEIDPKSALLTKVLIDLIDDPGGSVADGLHGRLGAETGRSGTVEAFAPQPIDTALKRSTITRRSTSEGMHETQFGLFPPQLFPTTLIRQRRVWGHDRHHSAIHFRHQPRFPRLRRPGRFGLMGLQDRLPVSFYDLSDRLHRQPHPIMLPQRLCRLLKRHIGPQIRHHPRQRLRATPMADLRTGRKTPLDLRPLTAQHLLHLNQPERTVPAQFFFRPAGLHRSLTSRAWSVPPAAAPKLEGSPDPGAGVHRSPDVPPHPPATSLHRRLQPDIPHTKSCNKTFFLLIFIRIGVISHMNCGQIASHRG